MFRHVVLVLIGGIVGFGLTPVALGQFGEKINDPGASKTLSPHVKPQPIKVVIDPADREVLLKLLTSAVKDTEGQVDPQVRIGTLVGLARGQSMLGEEQAARATVGKAKELLEGLPGDMTKIMSQISMANQLAEAGDLVQARELVVAAMPLLRQLNGNNRIHVSMSLGVTQAKIGEDIGVKELLEEELDLLTRMTNEAEWKNSLHVLCMAYIESDDLERALDIAEAIPDQLSDLKREILSRIVYSANRKTPEKSRIHLPRAIQLAKSLEPPSTRAQAMGDLAVVMAKSGNVTEAIAIASEITKNAKEPAIAQHAVPVFVAAAARFASGDKEKARADLDEAARLARAIPADNELRGQRLKLIAATQAKLGEFDQALKTAELFEKDDPAKAAALVEIGNAKIIAKDKAGAIELYRRAVIVVKAMPNEGQGPQLIQRKQQALVEAARGLALAGLIQEAISAERFLQEIDPQRQSYVGRYALGQIAEEAARGGNIDEALKLTDKLDEDWAHTNALTQVATIESEAGGEGHACSWISKLEDSQLRARLLSAVVQGIAKRSTNPSAVLPDLSQLKKPRS